MTRLSQRFGAWVVGLAALATAVVLRNGAGDYIADNRFEQYWNPGRRISRSFTLWDATRGMGRVREELWPGATVPIGLLRLLGAPPSLAEHLWHATLLTVAGAGMVALLRRFRPVLGIEHLFAALLYMFGPYAATFLVPSNLFYHYALTPWLAVTVHRGLHAERSWPAAAAFALLVFSVGNLDTPGLVYGGVAVLLVFVHEVAVAGAVHVRDGLRWLVRAGCLTVLVSAAAIAKTAIGIDSLSRRLESTETPDVIAAASSWAESARGLGFWLSYFRDAGGPVRPEGEPYFANPWMIVATFVPAVAGLGALWWVRRWRHQWLFLSLFVVGAFLMVGGYPADAPPPWGRAWLWAVRELPVVGTLRTTYKAGAVFALGAAGLFGMGVATAVRVWGTDAPRRLAILTSAAGVAVAVSAPAWSGGLYNAERRLDEVPRYWTDAMSWLDDQPGDGQVLLLPGATRSVYRWGWPGDDLHDALMDRAHLTSAAISLSGPLITDVLEAIDEAAVDGEREPRSMAPVLRRLGIRFVVLRNDLDWRRMGIARPGEYTDLRDDPDLEVVATFGRPGQNVATGGGALAAVERDLPPVEVLAVRGAVARTRASALGPWSLLEGGGDGWLAMAGAGLLDDDAAPIVPTALLDPTTLAEGLERGSSLIVTDSNRRRAQGLTAYSSERSRLLAPGEDLGRPIPDLYGVPGSQTTAAFADASSIDDPSVFRSLAGFRPEFRPAQAFDGDLRTGWVIGSLPDPRTRSLRVDFASPQVIDRVAITAFDPRDPDRSADPGASFAGVPRIGRVAIEFSDGETEYVNVITGRADVDLSPHRTTFVVLRVLDVTEPRDVGIAEVAFPGRSLDLAEHGRLPDDVFRLADGAPELRRRLERAPVTYLLNRAVGDGDAPVEAQLRRELRTLGDRSFELRGSLRWQGGAAPAAGPRGCTDIGLTVDGAAVEVRLDGTGPQTSFTACDRLVLSDGWHRVSGAREAQIDRLELAADGVRPAARGAAPQVGTSGSTGTTRTVEVDAPDGALVLSGDGYDARWRASADGHDLGAPLPADGQNAWVVPAGSGELRARFGPERLYRWALVTSFVSVLACVVIVTRAARRS